MRGPATLALLTLPALAASGCIDDLPLPQVIEDTRVLGARMEVDGEPDRAWPRPDETGVVTWQVVDPTDTASVGWGFIVCPAMVTPRGLAICVGDPYDVVTQMDPSTDVPTIPLTFPSTALAGANDVLLTGVFCPGGSPAIDPAAMDVSCVGGDEPRQLVTYTIRIERDGRTNRNPTFVADALTFAGSPWAEPTAAPPETGCAATAGTPELPLTALGDSTETGFDSMGNEVPVELIGITGDQADREEYTVGDETEREDLVFAHYATLGEPARQFSVVDDGVMEAELEWSYPSADEIDPDGSLVRFFFTLIDQRGGTDWGVRHLCVVP